MISRAVEVRDSLSQEVWPLRSHQAAGNCYQTPGDCENHEKCEGEAADQRESAPPVSIIAQGKDDEEDDQKEIDRDGAECAGSQRRAAAKSDDGRDLADFQKRDQREATTDGEARSGCARNDLPLHRWINGNWQAVFEKC